MAPSGARYFLLVRVYSSTVQGMHQLTCAVIGSAGSVWQAHSLTSSNECNRVSTIVSIRTYEYIPGYVDIMWISGIDTAVATWWLHIHTIPRVPNTWHYCCRTDNTIYPVSSYRRFPCRLTQTTHVGTSCGLLYTGTIWRQRGPPWSCWSA